MSTEFTFIINRSRFDENYKPKSNTRITTNFANLARGHSRKKNLSNALKMIDNRFNALANWDNPKGDRYSVELQIISVDIEVHSCGQHFPSIEIIETNIVDHKTQKRIAGIVGNNFSSYVRDYDFSVLLLEHNKDKLHFCVPENFGELHGKLFKSFIHSASYQQNFCKLPVICLSVSDTKTYHQTGNHHPVLGFEYLANDSSLTELYFKKMGLSVRYFMPLHSVAPLAFYFFGDLLNDYSNLELISTISTMETFQKIYRPEIYNSNLVAGKCYQPNLSSTDYSLTQITYDREERNRLASEQGKFAEEHFIKPHLQVLKRFSAASTLYINN